MRRVRSEERDDARYLDPVKMSAVSRTALATVWLLADAPQRPRMDKGYPPRAPRHH